jgi:GT2 family glycosyltransferase
LLRFTWSGPLAASYLRRSQERFQSLRLERRKLTLLDRLSIIIVNTNTRELVCQCLESVYASAPNCEFEVIVVDNASSDGSCEAIESRYPGARIIRNSRNMGFSVANNQALEIAKGEHLLLLNSDTIVPPGSLDKLIEAMERDNSLGIVAPKLVYPDGSLQMSYGPVPNLFVAFCTFFDVKRLFPTGFRKKLSGWGLAGMAGKSGGGYLSWFSGKSPETKLIDGDTYVTGACMLIRRECYEQVGGLDPGFFMYVDDADYSLRVHQKGWKILYVAEATIVHIKGGTVGERYRWTCAPAYQSMLYFLKKHRGSWAFYISKMFAVTAVFARWLGSTVKSRDERKRSWALVTELANF